MSLMDCVISNVAIATAITVLAAFIGRVATSPQIRHALWLHVLVKLVTPPLVELPFTTSASEWLGPVRGDIEQVDFSPNGQLLAVALKNGTVVILKSPWE